MVKQILRNKHVLIAEDNQVNQMVIVGMLKRLEMTADVCQDGKQALAQYQQQNRHYDLVLMDCECPKWMAIKPHNISAILNTSLISSL